MGDEGQDTLEGHRSPAPPRHSTPITVPQGEGREGPGRQLTVLPLPTLPLHVTPLGDDAVVVLGSQSRPWGLARGDRGPAEPGVRAGWGSRALIHSRVSGPSFGLSTEQA